MVAISPAIRPATPDRTHGSTATSRVSGVTRIAGGSVAAAAGVVCLSYRVYGWAAFFLVLAALKSRGWLLVPHHRCGASDGGLLCLDST